MSRNCVFYAHPKMTPGFSNKFIFLVCTSLLAFAANAFAEGPKSIFVKGTCNGKLSSIAYSSFLEQIRTSQKYHLIANLSDNGQMGVVIHVQMSCAEQQSVAAVATVYGVAKCFGPRNCHATMDGTSLRVTLCDPNTIADCGSALFREFDDYEKNPVGATLRLN